MRFKIILLTIIFLASFGYRSLGYAAQVIDINNLDPNRKWLKRLKQLLT